MVNSTPKKSEETQGNVTMPPEQISHTTPRLETLLGIYPIRKRLIQYLDTRDILKLCRTSWALRLDIKANDWNINHKLSHFFKNPMAFRSHLGRANALISGSFALQFFERVIWPESDLDIMVTDGDPLEELDKYLTESEGYTMVPAAPVATALERELKVEVIEEQNDDPDYSGHDIKKCNTYLFPYKDPNNGKVSERKVQLVVTRGPPVQAILRRYYTTAVMNFISWNKAYSVFPRATFLLHETVPLKPVGDFYGTLHAKYSQRGWRMRTESVLFSGAEHQQPLRNYQQPLGDLAKHASRRIGDRDSWVMRLGDTTGIEGSSAFVPDFVLEYSCFQVGNLHEQCKNLVNMSDWESIRDALHVSISAHTCRSHVLRYCYTMGYHNEFWWKLHAMIRQDTLGQLCKLGSSHIDELFVGILPRELDYEELNNASFEHPRGWDYMDDMIPLLYDQMEREGRIT